TDLLDDLDRHSLLDALEDLAEIVPNEIADPGVGDQPVGRSVPAAGSLIDFLLGRAQWPDILAKPLKEDGCVHTLFVIVDSIALPDPGVLPASDASAQAVDLADAINIVPVPPPIV